MTLLSDQYLAKTGGHELAASVLLARDLMRGDSASLKAGYTAPNAAWVAQDFFGIQRDEIETVLDDEQAKSWQVGITATCEHIAGFDTHDEAAEFIGHLPRADHGIYFLDGPCDPTDPDFEA